MPQKRPDRVSGPPSPGAMVHCVSLRATLRSMNDDQGPDVDDKVGKMQAEDSQQPAQGQGKKRKTVLSPELREVLHMLKSLETKPAQG